MNVSGAQYQLKIQALRQEKNQTEDEIKVLADRSSEWQLKVYRLILVINAEIANKHFKEVNSELLLPNRISSAVALMENEINRLEVGMDMAGEVDADFDSCLERLKTNIESWNEMQNEIRSPILTSTLFTKSLEVLERHGKDEFPNADKVTLVDDAAFLEQAVRRGESIQSIVATSEVAMADQAMYFDQALEENVQRVVRGMDGQCLEAKQHFEDERDARSDLLDAMYEDLLAKFLADTEQSSSRFKESYAAIEHKKREEDLVSIATHGSATHHSWKTELDSKMRHTLLAEQQARALEAQLDSLLLNELEESTISVLPHGMDDSYLQILMDKLTDLYLESSEIQLKQRKLTS